MLHSASRTREHNKARTTRGRGDRRWGKLALAAAKVVASVRWCCDVNRFSKSGLRLSAISSPGPTSWRRIRRRSRITSEGGSGRDGENSQCHCQGICLKAIILLGIDWSHDSSHDEKWSAAIPLSASTKQASSVTSGGTESLHGFLSLTSIFCVPKPAAWPMGAVPLRTSPHT